MIRLLALLSAVVAAVVVAGCGGCEPPLPLPPTQCDAAGKGCLPDEECVEGECRLRAKCEADDECPGPAWECALPAQICALRPGFGEECSVDAPCDPGSFCALGRCRETASARPCATRGDCPGGQSCSQLSFLCIEDAPCTLADAFPEVACENDETCDVFSERCRAECQEQCTVETQLEDCGPGRLCDAACRCVQCLTDDDCGAGLVCNQRAGRCESENLCFSDDDCEKPLVCDPRTALCQVPPPPCEDDGDCAIAEICNRASGVCELPGGACVDDRFEDADTPANAEPLALLPAGQELLIDDLRLCPDDDDVFAIPLLRGESMIARATGTAAAARATMWLLDAQGETSLAFSETPPRGAGAIEYVAQADETVFVRLNALVGQTPYDLAVTVGTGTACTADPFEGGAGNDQPTTPTPAASVPIGPTLVGSICPGDVDWYEVTVAAGEALDAVLAFDAVALDFDLAIFDPSTNTLLAQSAGLQAPETVRVRAAANGSLLVRVQGFGNAVGTYNLTLSRLAPVDCTVDAFEPDDDVAAAPVLDVETSVVGAQRAICAADRDQYQVVLRDFERVVAHATYASSDLEVTLQVLDATGAVVKASSPLSTGGATVTYDAQGDETVLVRATSRLNAAGTYVLDVGRENKVSCAPDALEPNDTVATAASPPTADRVLTICDYDEDYFTFTGVAGKILHAHLSFLHADGDLDLMVLNAEGTNLLAVSDSVGDGEDVRVELPVDGEYTIRVFALSGARARYQLLTELLGP